MAVLIQEQPMLHNFETDTLKVQLARQARMSSVVLMMLSALALAKLLALVFGALST
jgi:hypothetical protein